jgi:hypothetical protein
LIEGKLLVASGDRESDSLRKKMRWRSQNQNEENA